MKSIQVLILVALAVGLGCSFKQDPLAEKADVIKDAQKPAPPAQKPDPIDSQALTIEAPLHIGVIEGGTAHITITSRVNMSDYNAPALVIENMDAFPGAKFDPVTHEFTWTPAVGMSGDDIGRQMYLNIRANATSSKDKTPLTRGTVVSILVIKNPQEPTVAKIQGIPRILREDKTYRFDIYVTDFDSHGVKAKAPSLMFLQPLSGLSLASFLEVTYMDYDTNTLQWRFSCLLRVDANVTTSSEWTGFSVKVASQFGKMSQVASYSGKLYTALQKVQSTWPDDVVLKPQVENKVKFIIYDPQGEGVLALNSSDQELPFGAMLVCERQRTGPLECELTYTPPGIVGSEDSGKLSFDVTSENKDSTDPEKGRTDFYLRFRVEALPQPPPPPPPPPGPTPTPAPAPEPSPRPSSTNLVRGER